MLTSGGGAEVRRCRGPESGGADIWRLTSGGGAEVRSCGYLEVLRSVVTISVASVTTSDAVFNSGPENN